MIRFTELSVSYSPRAMLSGGGRPGRGDLWLETRSEGGCWSRAPGDPIQRGSHRLLHRLEIFPCQVRLLRLLSLISEIMLTSSESRGPTGAETRRVCGVPGQ